MEKETQEIVTVGRDYPERVVTTKHVIQPLALSTEHPQKTFKKKKTIFRFYQVIWYILSLIEILLVFRFILKALGANSYSGFTAFIYSITDILVLPFQGIFRTSVTGGNIFEWATIIAAAVYTLLAYGLVELFQFIKPVSVEEVEETVDE